MTDQQNLTRRTLLGKLGIGAAAAALLPAIASADTPIQSAPPAVEALSDDEQLLVYAYQIVRNRGGDDGQHAFELATSALFLALCSAAHVADGVTLSTGFDMRHLAKRQELFGMAEEMAGEFLGTGGPGAKRVDSKDLTQRLQGLAGATIG